MQPSSGKMQGTLWKWTNYFSGWQPRWFVLDNGILSYYRSQEDVVNGCKGSIKMSVCDVSVHTYDPTRLDLIIPGEAHFYVKAATSQERQEWLIALGSCKAGVSYTVDNTPTYDKQEELKAKKSELRLYCDLLMQQVYSVKSAVQDTPSLDIQQLNESTSLLRATCDTFITTLDDCMQLVNTSSSGQSSPTNITPPIRNNSRTMTPGLTSPSRQSSSEKRASTPEESTPAKSFVSTPPRGSPSRTPSDSSSPVKSKVMGGQVTVSEVASQTPVQSKSNTSVDTVTDSLSHTSDDGSVYLPAVERLSPAAQTSHTDVMSQGDSCSPSSKDSSWISSNAAKTVPNYFTSMKTSFADVQLLDDNGIPTAQFLNVCRELVPFFDKLNATTYAPMKIEFSSHTKRVQQKFSSDPDCFCTVQYIIKYEVKKIQHINEQSATKSLIWIKRMLDFIKEFLTEFINGATDLQLASNNAYTRSLKDYHSYIVRGVYTMAVKSAPAREEFVKTLYNHEEMEASDLVAEVYLMQDIQTFLRHLCSILDIMEEVFEQNNVNGIAVM